MQTTTSAGKLTRLVDFRQSVYDKCVLSARDALFELSDAMIVSRAINSFAELSLSSVFRRRWPSLYEALADGGIDDEASLGLLINQVRRERPASSQPLIFAVDHTPMPREQSYTLAERGFWHKATAVPGNRPITIGYDFSTIAWVPHTEQEPDSWCLPLLHERIRPESSPLATASEQLARVLASLGEDAARVVIMGDSEYASAPFLKATAELACSRLCRLRPNRMLYQPPPAYSGRGRRRIHGAKFRLKDPTTWSQPVEEQHLQDAKLGQMRLRRWEHLHFEATPQIAMTLLLVEQLTSDGTSKQSMWLLWVGEHQPPIEQIWRLYLRRYAIDHWYRFAKQRLHWCLPKLSTPERTDCWSALLPLGQWQLYLAREVVEQVRLPWQKPLERLTPAGVADSFAGLLPRIGTPARPPKRRGKSPGWTPGRCRARRQQHTIERKTTRRWSSTPAKPP
jgi:hypothetical protein